MKAIKLMTIPTCTPTGAEMQVIGNSSLAALSVFRRHGYGNPVWLCCHLAMFLNILKWFFDVDDFIRINGASLFTKVPLFSHWRTLGKIINMD